MSETCGNGHPWEGNEYWVTVKHRGRLIKRRYCWECKKGWKRKNGKPAQPLPQPLALDGSAEYETPSLQVRLKPTMDFLRADGVRFRRYPNVQDYREDRR